MLGEPEEEKDKFLDPFKRAYDFTVEFTASYIIKLEDSDKTLFIRVDNGELACEYGMRNKVDVFMRTNEKVLMDIFAGGKTFQSSFMSGAIIAKGNFNTLRMLDKLFVFKR